MKRLVPLVAFLLAASPAFAAHWTVDAAKSKLGFTATWSKQPFGARFKTWKASIDFDPADLAHATADVTVDIASEASDQSELDDALKGAQGFAATQFPTAHFVTTGFRSKGGNAYVATGTLTLHGISKPVVMPFNLTITGKTAHMTGTAALLRTDFGVGGEATDPVAHAVIVTVDLTATQ
ncbi:MAG TPA: YceI family protein [Rhizomicrobium sp.]|jgi:polyisoprenoid-binding protein YceI|nr:YceI family protein [Rhizomicrobium sp.]